VLTSFQERIAAMVAGLDEAEDFALAGGGVPYRSPNLPAPAAEICDCVIPTQQ
jgi:hypothetical protein